MTLEEEVGRLLTERGETLAIAESLTGGLVTSRITDVPGSSAYLVEGVIAYANEAKEARLGVEEATLIAHGAVSEPVAREMAEGIMKRAGTTWGISTTGIAGPTGATEEKPLGLVYVAVAGPQGTEVRRNVFPGTRLAVKHASSEAVLALLLEQMEAPS
ncbi:MAG: nicotinamide-nucleotide amidohydrolase family protein [Thermoplasmata archaeon]|nr:nicotinamide-nucleotide amidohydrolase family protein [Thermoplasmata archaeon]